MPMTLFGTVSALAVTVIVTVLPLAAEDPPFGD